MSAQVDPIVATGTITYSDSGLTVEPATVIVKGKGWVQYQFSDESTAGGHTLAGFTISADASSQIDTVVVTNNKMSFKNLYSVMGAMVSFSVYVMDNAQGLISHDPQILNQPT